MPIRTLHSDSFFPKPKPTEHAFLEGAGYPRIQVGVGAPFNPQGPLVYEGPNIRYTLLVKLVGRWNPSY
eukprot:5205467-Pyramimonas_sp.AAC.1